MNNLHFSDKRYAEKLQAFNELRAGATALKASMSTSRQLQVWSPARHDGADALREKQSRLGRDIGAMAHFFDNKGSAALDIIHANTFSIHYQIYGDIEREAVFGQNTLGLTVEVEWSRLGVETQLYPAFLDKTLPREKFTAAAREGIPNRDDVAKTTGWSREAVRGLADDQISMFKNLLEQVRVGQSKLTRLVKGFLILLECMERGYFDVDLAIQNLVLYSPRDVIHSFATGGRAYVYNSTPSSRAHSAVLWRMCGEYPPPELAGSHVAVPADADHVYMVAEGQLPPNGTTVRLNPNLIYSSIMRYAMDCSCTQYIQQALIIACSLQQNRYFSKVGLPAVASTFDLMVPAFVTTSTRLDKPAITIEMAKSVGRVHQMLAFVSTRDLISAAELSTKPGRDPILDIKTYLRSQASVLQRNASFLSDINLLEAASGMRTHNLLDQEDIQDIMSVSILEGLWLCDSPKKCVKGGVIEALIRGIHDMGSPVSKLTVLERELLLANTVFNPRHLPHGNFTLGWVAVGLQAQYWVRKKLGWKRKTAELVMECEYNPRNAPAPRRKERIRATPPPTAVTTPRTVIPVTYIKERAHRRNATSTSTATFKSPPPTYRQPETEQLPSTPSIASEESELLVRTRLAREAAQATGSTEYASSSPDYGKVGDKSDQLTEAERAREAETGSPVAARRVSISAPPTKKEEFETEWRATFGPKPLSDDDAEVVTRLKDFSIKLNETERAHWTRILKETKTVVMFSFAKTLDNFFERAERQSKFVNYKGENMPGNSNLAKRINALLDVGRQDQTSGSILSEMISQGKLWSGDIATVPAAGIKHVQRSESWLSYLLAQGVDPEALVGDNSEGGATKMKYAIANKISVFPGLSVKGVKLIADWLTGVATDKMPGLITDDDLLSAGAVRHLEYRVAPTSLRPRNFQDSDSRWLVLAAAIQRPLFEPDYLKRLCAEFRVERAQRDSLRQVYGLFDQASVPKRTTGETSK